MAISVARGMNCKYIVSCSFFFSYCFISPKSLSVDSDEFLHSNYICIWANKQRKDIYNDWNN